MTYDGLTFVAWTVLLFMNVVMAVLCGSRGERRWSAWHAGVASVAVAILIWTAR